MKLTLMIWRQKSRNDKGAFETHQVSDVLPEMSFLEMLDQLNNQLVREGKLPFEFDSDCREGICGTCGLVINGMAHGPKRLVATCQVYMRSFTDGQVISIEPWRAGSFPVERDLVVDRSAFDRIIQAGGYTSAKTGPHPDANANLIPKPAADEAFDYATCIGCGACVAACPNASASLFTAAKIAQLELLPQGKTERERRAVRMVQRMDMEGFGNCTNIGECQAACPKGISIDAIATMKREFMRGVLLGSEGKVDSGG